MNHGKLEVVKHEMDRLNINILGISELKWTGTGHLQSDEYRVFYAGNDSIRRNRVTIILKTGIEKTVWGYNAKTDRIILIRLKAIPPQKKSIFVKKFEIEINAWEDSSGFALSETLWFFIGRPFFDEVFSRFLSLSVKERHFFLEKECFEVFARNLR